MACVACGAGNISQETKPGWDFGDGKWYIQPSIGAFAGDFGEVPMWQGLLHSIAVLISLADLIAFRWYLNKRGEELDFETIRPSHFTLWLKDLKRDFDPSALIEFLSKSGKGGIQAAEVHSINVPYDISRFVSTSRRAAKLKAKQLYLQEYRNVTGEEAKSFFCRRPIDAEAIEKNLAAVEQEIEKQEKAFEGGIGELQLGQAFVTFKRQTDARAVAMNWSRSGLNRYIRWLCSWFYPQTGEFQGGSLSANLAPEPSDILWENLSIPLPYRVCRRTVTWTLMLLVVIGSFFLSLLIKSKQQDWLSIDTSQSDYTRFKLFSLLLSFAIVAINQILGIIARLLTAQEKHQTWTNFYLSVCYKVSIFQVLNTTVLLLVINSVRLSGLERHYSWWTPNGLVNDLLNLMYVECTVGPLTSFCSPRHILKLIQRFRLDRRAKAGLITVTQSQANE